MSLPEVGQTVDLSFILMVMEGSRQGRCALSLSSPGWGLSL